MKSSRKRFTRLMAFGPALVIVCVTAYAASGVSIVGSATGASTVGVTGSVGVAASADPDLTGGDCADDGTNETLAAAWATTGAFTDGCTITFYTNNTAGAEVLFEDDNGSATNFFCGDADPTAGYQAGTRDCATDVNAVDNVAGTAGGDPITADTFGIGLTALGGGGSPAAGSGVEAAQAAALATAMWYPINSTQAQLCTSTAPNTSSTQTSCTFALAGQGEGVTQGAGDYLGTVRLTQQAN